MVAVEHQMDTEHLATRENLIAMKVQPVVGERHGMVCSGLLVGEGFENNVDFSFNNRQACRNCGVAWFAHCCSWSEMSCSRFCTSGVN